MDSRWATAEIDPHDSPTRRVGTPPNALSSHVYRGPSEISPQRLANLSLTPFGPLPFPVYRDPRWLIALQRGLGHEPYLIETARSGRTVGWLPLILVRSVLFGRFLVSLPYVNSAGVVAEDETVAEALVNSAVQLADELDVRYLELRHETAVPHPALTHQLTNKVHMRLALPESVDELSDSIKAKVRNQLRKAQRYDFSIAWGAVDLVREFHDVFSHNMRDLGTPTYGRGFFRVLLETFPQRAEICCLREGNRPIAVALALHGQGVTEVPSASSLRAYRPTNANMLLYWHLLERAVLRGQRVFDFGRSSRDSSTFRFKKQWGARPEPAVWQYYLRKGRVDDLRPENEKFGRAIRIWQRLPLAVTRCLGPLIVRGIP